jgi:Cu+-exporting ATPase
MGLERNGSNEKKITLLIEGMSCPHCSGAVQAALGAVPGVKSVSVDLPGGRAEVTYSGNFGIESLLIEAVIRAGYKASI